MAHFTFKLKFIALSSKIMLGVNILNFVFSIVFFHSSFNIEKYIEDRIDYLYKEDDLRIPLADIASYFLVIAVHSTAVYFWMNKKSAEGEITERTTFAGKIINNFIKL